MMVEHQGVPLYDISGTPHLQKLTCADDFEVAARKMLNPAVYEYYRSGSDDEVTLRRNRHAFRNVLIKPSVLDKPVKNLDTSTTVLNGKFETSIPIGISPSAFHRYAHRDAEVATVKACVDAGAVMILSGWSSTPLEEVAAAGGQEARLWQNLTIWRDREKTFELIRRAEAAGFHAIALSVNIQVLSKRRSERNWATCLHREYAPGAHFSNGDEDQYQAGDPTVTWADFEQVCKATSLPIVVKGIMTSDDAVKAISHGASAILVSNHGGRQLDSLPATIEVLPDIARAVKGKCDIYIDGGFRTGNDIFKALALGAKAAFVGRPAIWGLTYAGKTGVLDVLNCLKEELEITMALAGCQNLSEIGPEKLYKLGEFSKI